jgi:hypothetical protein
VSRRGEIRYVSGVGSRRRSLQRCVGRIFRGADIRRLELFLAGSSAAKYMLEETRAVVIFSANHGPLFFPGLFLLIQRPTMLPHERTRQPVSFLP